VCCHGPAVVSRYIHNPLLVLGGNKFDLRLYVLVPSFNPLVVSLQDTKWLTGALQCATFISCDPCIHALDKV
jgi:hypothetical protein